MFILYVLEMQMTIYNVFPKKYIAIIIMLLAAVMPSAATDIITCSEEVENGMWVCFRKTFELAEAPSENTLRISADSKYRLYVNGEIVVREGQLKRGPNPHDSYIDSLGIKNLRKGKNTVAVLVWYFGKGGYSHRSSSHAGLYFDLSGKAFRVSSDSSWKSRLHPAYYIPTGQKPNARLAESNIGYDARQELQSFADTLYNDSAWRGERLRFFPSNGKQNLLLSSLQRTSYPRFAHQGKRRRQNNRNTIRLLSEIRHRLRDAIRI